MGDHKLNGNAIAKAARQPPAVPDEIYSCDMQPAIEINAATMAEITRVTDAAALAGEDPRLALHREAMEFNPMTQPERFDLVIYLRALVARPSKLAIRSDQVPRAMIRGPELWRVPLNEVRARASQMFDSLNRANDPPLQ